MRGGRGGGWGEDRIVNKSVEGGSNGTLGLESERNLQERSIQSRGDINNIMLYSDWKASRSTVITRNHKIVAPYKACTTSKKGN